MQNNFEKKIWGLYEFFTTTKYGRVLAGMTRFERYKPEDASAEQWEVMMGADINNLKHALATYELTREFLEQEEDIDERDKEAIFLAAIVHDWAESVVGDPMFDLKTSDHAQKELVALKKIAEEIMGQYGDNYLLELFPITVEEVLTDQSSSLWKIFNAIERIGYMNVALAAWKHALIAKQSGHKRLALHLQFLMNNVFYNQIPTLLEYKKQYSYVETFLSEHNDIITAAFAQHDDKAFLLYNQGEDKRVREAFYKAREKWENREEELIKINS